MTSWPSAESFRRDAWSALSQAASFAREQADRVAADVREALELPPPGPSEGPRRLSAPPSGERHLSHPIAEGYAEGFEVITQEDVAELMRVDRALMRAQARVLCRPPARGTAKEIADPPEHPLRGGEGQDPEDVPIVDVKASIVDPVHGLALCEEILLGPEVPEVDTADYADLVAAVPASTLAVIDRDVPRTFPSHPAFADPQGTAARALRNILAAQAVRDPEVGYVQGMNFVAASILLQCESNERRAFAFFARLLASPAHRMRELYLPGLPGLHMRLHQFEALLQEHRPHVAACLRHLDVPASFYAQEWFLTLFAYSLPLNLVELLTRAFIVEGWVAVMRLGVAVLDHLAPQLMGASFEDAMRLFKAMQHEKDSTAPGEDGDEWVLVTPDTLVLRSLDLPIHTHHLERVEARLQFPILGTLPQDA